jgi:predicted dehydrogenase
VTELRLGVLGSSEGNGHPYSWSAIVNGYDRAEMERCPFPAIPEYLSRRSFPDDSIADARVTHVWTQDRRVSEAVARAALIDEVVDEPDDMIGAVDAVLLARDDAESHRELAQPFLLADLPVYIDKPLATTVDDARAIYALARRPAQVFSCTPLRFADEFAWTADRARATGTIVSVEASTPSRWETYAVHVIEPTLEILRGHGGVETSERIAGDGRTDLRVGFANGVRATFTALGASREPISIRVNGERGSVALVFEDSFSAFKSALEAFLRQVRTGVEAIPRSAVLQVVELVEAGSA